MFLSRGDRDLGVAFQTHPGRQAFISSGENLVVEIIAESISKVGKETGIHTQESQIVQKKINSKRHDTL